MTDSTNTRTPIHGVDVSPTGAVTCQCHGLPVVAQAWGWAHHSADQARLDREASHLAHARYLGADAALAAR